MALVAGGDVNDGSDLFELVKFAFRVSPDGLRVVYRADQDVDQEFELYSAPSDGSLSPVKLNSPLAGDFEADASIGKGFEITPDSSTVIYAAEQDTLRSLPILGLSDRRGRREKDHRRERTDRGCPYLRTSLIADLTMFSSELSSEANDAFLPFHPGSLD